MMKEYYLMYLRKSRQDNELETVQEVLARHERQLQDFAIRLTGEKIEEKYIFREIVSGETIEDRPKIKEVLKLVQDTNCKGVIVIEPQRLTRGDLIDLGNIIYAFQYSNTLVLTPTKTYDLSNKYDREFFERELLRGKDFIEYTKEVLMRGRNASSMEGNFVGSTPVFAYDRVKIGKSWTLVPNEKDAEFVRMAFNWYVNDGLGANAIAHRLNELGAKPRKAERFTASTIRQMLANETYIGKIRWQAKPVVRVFEDGKIVKKRIRNKNYTLIDGKHDAIIDEELFKKAQERKGTNTRERVDYELQNIYSGLIKCKKCGGAIAQRIHRKQGVVTRADRYYCRTGIYCDNKSANADVVKEVILRTLKAYLQDFEVKIEDDNKSELEAHDRLIANLEKELEQLESKQEELYNLLEDRIYSKELFAIRNDKLAKEREELINKIKKARLYKPSVEENQQKYYSLFEAIQSIENPHISAKQKNILLKNIIEVIYYEKNENSSTRGETIDNANFSIEVILK